MLLHLPLPLRLLLFPLRRRLPRGAVAAARQEHCLLSRLFCYTGRGKSFDGQHHRHQYSVGDDADQRLGVLGRLP